MAIYVFPTNPENSLPGITISADTSDFTGSSSNSAKPLMLVGTADDGKPNTVYNFNNYSEAAEVLRGGDLLKALRFAWSPDVNGDYYAGNIQCVRVNPATQASLTQGTLTFTSKLWSKDANQILVSLEDNPATKDKRLTVMFPPTGEIDTYDHLGNILSLYYNGNYPYAGAQIKTDADGYAEHLILTAGASQSSANVMADLSIGDRGAYQKTNGLINAISAVPGFNADRAPFSRNNTETKYYHELDQTQLPSGTGLLYVTALEGDILTTIANNNNFVDVTYTPVGTPLAPSNVQETSIVDGVHISVDQMQTVQPLTNFGTQALSGAKVGVSPDSWLPSFQQLASQYSTAAGYYLIPLTDDLSIQQEASQFVQDQSSDGNVMRCIVGSGLDETKQKLLSRATALNSDRTALVGSSANLKMPDGSIEEEPGYMVAALVGGVASGIDVGDSITYKQLSVVSLSTNYSLDDLNDLNSGGVIMLAFNRIRATGSFRIVDDVTTYTDSYDDDPLMTEMAVGEGSDFVISDLKDRLTEDYIGSKITNNDANLLSTSIATYLSDDVNNEILEDYDENSISVIINGSVATISAVVYPIRTMKKINISLKYENETITNIGDGE